MRILLISPLPPPTGGIASWTKSFLNSDDIKKHYVELINTAVKGQRIKGFTKKKFIEEIKRAFNIIISTNKALNNNFDIVHLNTSCSKMGIIRDYIIAIMVGKKRSNLVLHCHCDVDYMLSGLFAKIFFKKMCRRANKIFVLNKDSKEYVKKSINRDSILIPNYINTDNLIKCNKKLYSNNIKKILFVGHVVNTKGCRDIITVSKYFEDKEFIFVGYLSDEIRKLDHLNNVKFLGEKSKEDVFKIMQESDILLFPTYTEGFPMVILEAMYNQLPIITTKVGAIQDILEEDGGIFVDVKDIDGIINAINIMESLELRIKMINWNEKKVLNYYTVDKVMKKILKEYYDLMREPQI